MKKKHIGSSFDSWLREEGKGSVRESGSIRLWTRASSGSFRGQDERPSHVAGIDAFSRSHRPFGVVERGSRIEAQLDRHLSCPDLGDMHKF